MVRPGAPANHRRVVRVKHCECGCGYCGRNRVVPRNFLAFVPVVGWKLLFFWSNGSRARAAFRRPCPVLLDLSSLTYASKPASSASKIPRTLLAEICKAVFSERIFVQARHWPQVILDVLPRTITKHGRKTARKIRYGFDTRWTKEL